MTAVASVTGRAPRPSTFPRVGTIHMHETWVSVWEDQVDDMAMRAVLGSVVARMRDHRGFDVVVDPDVLKRHPILAKDHFYARKGDLEAKVERCGRTLKVEFFQNVANVDNMHGGKYDFDKYTRMPRTMRMQCVVEMRHLLLKFRELGYVFDKPVFTDDLTVLDVQRAMEPKQHRYDLESFNDGWDGEYEKKRGIHRFKRDETGWPAPEEYRSWPCLDGDGQEVRNGDMRYLRVDGYLVYGVARPGVNGQWFLDGKAVAWGTRDLFTCDPTTVPRRLVAGQQARLQKELAKATKESDWKRVRVLAGVLERMVAK